MDQARPWVTRISVAFRMNCAYLFGGLRFRNRSIRSFARRLLDHLVLSYTQRLLFSVALSTQLRCASCTSLGLTPHTSLSRQPAPEEGLKGSARTRAAPPNRVQWLLPYGGRHERYMPTTHPAEESNSARQGLESRPLPERKVCGLYSALLDGGSSPCVTLRREGVCGSRVSGFQIGSSSVARISYQRDRLTARRGNLSIFTATILGFTSRPRCTK